MIYNLLKTSTDRSILLIRLLVGLVFLSEGIQKFVLPGTRGPGRFQKIGLPYPEFLGTAVGAIELVAGLLIVLGLFTRLAAFPLFCIMITAIAVTKTTVFQQDGFWELLHGSRTDWSMLLGSIFLMIKGAGYWSADYAISNKVHHS